MKRAKWVQATMFLCKERRMKLETHQGSWKHSWLLLSTQWAPAMLHLGTHKINHQAANRSANLLPHAYTQFSQEKKPQHFQIPAQNKFQVKFHSRNMNTGLLCLPGWPSVGDSQPGLASPPLSNLSALTLPVFLHGYWVSLSSLCSGPLQKLSPVLVKDSRPKP